MCRSPGEARGTRSVQELRQQRLRARRVQELRQQRLRARRVQELRQTRLCARSVQSSGKHALRAQCPRAQTNTPSRAQCPRVQMNRRFARRDQESRWMHTFARAVTVTEEKRAVCRLKSATPAEKMSSIIQLRLMRLTQMNCQSFLIFKICARLQF